MLTQGNFTRLNNFKIFFNPKLFISRGCISWTDFTNYCLRVGRNRFRPNTKQSAIEYFQRMDLQPVLPVRKMCFIHGMQLLYCFDNETSIVRIMR